MSLKEQFFTFLLSFSLGYGAGFAWDFYHALRKGLRLRRWGTSCGDLLFWVVLTGAVFGFLLLVTWGEMRWYVFFGLGLGAVAYRRTLGPRGCAFWARVVGTGLQAVHFLTRRKQNSSPPEQENFK